MKVEDGFYLSKLSPIHDILLNQDGKPLGLEYRQFAVCSDGNSLIFLYSTDPDGFVSLSESTDFIWNSLTTAHQRNTWGSALA